MSIPIEKLVSPAADWTGDTWAQRLEKAASLLFIHGYIPESQRKRIADKLDGQFKRGLSEGRIVPAQPTVPQP